MSQPVGIVADIGGTHARFATVSCLTGGSGVVHQCRVMRTTDFPAFEAAYEEYVSGIAFAPRRAVFALATPIAGCGELKLTNNPWTLDPSALAAQLGLEDVRCVNDFEAIGWGLPRVSPENLRGLDGGHFQLPGQGVVSIVGPGSGLGVALLSLDRDGDRVHTSEGGHAGFAPADEVDAHILRFLSARYRPVSAERLISGPGLVEIYLALAALDGREAVPPRALALWDAAIAGADPFATAALLRWQMLLGSFAGDVALAHGAAAVVFAGGILPRLGARLDHRLIAERFCAKGRLETAMRKISLAMIKQPEPGLFGAATLLLNGHMPGTPVTLA
ncbi:MAG: glucokinase [Parvibaculum sp.]|uniref:glucokinase n=1 Tax=Parvibaculum sp. TaxID=2024848 RepID=UPI0025FBD7CC|nr:glucokinase [Parvibaculum sp.]MCE9651128.1 glucokinase [Parvibaculum sp.]